MTKPYMPKNYNPRMTTHKLSISDLICTMNFSVLRSQKLAIVLFLVGCIFLGQSFYMDAKAKLAQVLIAHSWAVGTQYDTELEVAPKPWWWADTRAIAKLEVPRLNKQLFVMQDDSGESLAFGPGHLPGSARPSKQGHVMIAGHRDSHFAFLEHVVPGDLIHTTNLQGQLITYRVDQTQIFNADQDTLKKLDNNQLSLITCYPFNGLIPGGPLRYLITATPLFEQSQTNEGSITSL